MCKRFASENIKVPDSLKDPDEGYTGNCLELPGAISEGDTIEELRENMTEAIQLVLETIEDDHSADEKIIIEIPNQV